MNKEIEKLLETYKEDLFEIKRRFGCGLSETDFGKWIAYSRIVEDLEKIIKKDGVK